MFIKYNRGHYKINYKILSTQWLEKFRKDKKKKKVNKKINE